MSARCNLGFELNICLKLLVAFKRVRSLQVAFSLPILLQHSGCS